MAQIQKVRYQQPQHPLWKDIVGGFMSGAMGSVAAGQQKEQDKQRAWQALQPALINKGYVGPSSEGVPGSYPVGSGWLKPMDQSNMESMSERKDRLQGDKLSYELDPDSQPEAFRVDQVKKMVMLSLLSNQGYRNKLKSHPEIANRIAENGYKIALGNYFSGAKGEDLAPPASWVDQQFKNEENMYKNAWKAKPTSTPASLAPTPNPTPTPTSSLEGPGGRPIGVTEQEWGELDAAGKTAMRQIYGLE